MIQKVTIKGIWIDRTPTQYNTFKTNIKCKEYGDRWISGFAKQCEWKDGDTIELDIFDNAKGIRGKDGNVYLNWAFVNKEKVMEKELTEMKNTVRGHTQELQKIREFLDKNFTSAGTKVPDFTPNTPQEQQVFKEKMEVFESKRDTKVDDINGALDAIAEEDYARM